MKTKRKRGKPRKRIYENELPEINMQKGSRTKVESDSDSDPHFDPEYLDYLKEIQAKNKNDKNGKKPKKFTIPQEEETENYFSTSEDEAIDIEPEDEENSKNSCIEEIFENENIEDTFNERNSEINKKRQLETRENLENYNNSEFEENRPPPEPSPPNSESTRQILTNKNIVECRDQLTMPKDNYVYFVTTNRNPRDNGSKCLEKRGTSPKFKHLQEGTTKEKKKRKLLSFCSSD